MFRNFKFSFFQIILLVITFKSSFQQPATCTNPNGTPGKCTSMYYCQSLIKTIYREPLLERDRSFLVNSQCSKGIGPLPHVCCTNDEEYKDGYEQNTSTKRPLSQDEINNSLNQNKNAAILPSSSQCGPSPLEHRIYNGKDADLGEFPWMVLLEYRKKNGDVIPDCAGSIINSKYILTAAHCLTGKILTEIGPLVSVRLGEHDLTQDLDCVDCGVGCLSSSCADPVIFIEPDEIIPHEEYNDSHKQHDIGLIRLKNHINFTAFIRPVCLPSAVNLQRTLPGEEIIVSGWGRTTSAAKSNVKQKLQVPVINQNDCISKFATKKQEIKESQICAGGKFYEDSCDGDSGGPLMKQSGLKWTIEGVVSFGNRCGLEGWPGIYTRVSSYEDWIKSKLKP
ncbi:serine protease 7 [Condylostylus longicornis]|uniref:serine protease 7 n=1 Tax=Condylostylus longicornis TaxID=2530218 RepID=UPI00244E3B3D|nr:serine protease 7 [Condylostylus longicornis]